MPAIYMRKYGTLILAVNELVIANIGIRSCVNNAKSCSGKLSVSKSHKKGTMDKYTVDIGIDIYYLKLLSQ